MQRPLFEPGVPVWFTAEHVASAHNVPLEVLLDELQARGVKPKQYFDGVAFYDVDEIFGALVELWNSGRAPAPEIRLPAVPVRIDEGALRRLCGGKR